MDSIQYQRHLHLLKVIFGETKPPRRDKVGHHYSKDKLRCCDTCWEKYQVERPIHWNPSVVNGTKTWGAVYDGLTGDVKHVCTDPKAEILEIVNEPDADAKDPSEIEMLKRLVVAQGKRISKLEDTLQQIGDCLTP